MKLDSTVLLEGFSEGERVELDIRRPMGESFEDCGDDIASTLRKMAQPAMRSMESSGTSLEEELTRSRLHL